MTSTDPNADTLAAIASILEKPVQRPMAVASPEDPTGYSRTGPGPFDALRVKWTVRKLDDGRYVVDETVGQNPTPLSSAPMGGNDARKFVDDRENEAQERFAQLHAQMTGSRDGASA